ncbi:cysteinyl-tRNA synthetase [Entomortierella beljakovae]|nr:cysteinyl-tRNA synthetase [Entomortierella beljakovae]
MAPSQPGLREDRKGSTGSNTSSNLDPPLTSSSAGERRPSANSGYFPSAYHNTRMNSDHGSSISGSSVLSMANSASKSPFINEERGERPKYNTSRSNLDPNTAAKAPSSSNGRKKNTKGNGDSNGKLSFLRSSSRPPSPETHDSTQSQSHTRKTSFSGHSNNNSHRTVVMSGSLNSLHSIGNNSIHHNNGANQNGSSFNNNGQQNSYHYNVAGQSQSHPFDIDPERRRSTESYSRTSSPERTEQQQQQYQLIYQQAYATNQKHGFPMIPPAHVRPHQRTDSMKNSKESHHRRTKSIDYGDTLFKKRPLLSHNQNSSSASGQNLYYQQQQLHNDSKLSKSTKIDVQKDYGVNGSRKCSADEQYITSPPSSTIHPFTLGIYSDHDHPQNGAHNKRHGSDASDSAQRAFHYMTGKKGSKKDHHEAVLPGFVVDLNDMSGIKGDSKHNQLRSAATPSGAETWHAPESWGVQPVPGPPRLLPFPDELTSEDLGSGEFENWDKSQEKVSTIRIFRPDTTYTTVNCDFKITANQLSATLGKKIFKPDTSKYHLYILRNNIVRQLAPYERPLSILRRLLLQFGYTDQDKLEELSGKDNSFICRFTFAENGAPLITEADFPEYNNYADVNLQKRCLPTIPIFLYSRAKDIVRLNISHNQRMDLPLDFVQNCAFLRELRMAFNDLDRVPSNVRSIAHLQYLDLRGNRIKSLDDSGLHEARELVTLQLQSNRLEDIPDSFQQFEYLRTLGLSSNNFATVPVILFQIASLEELDLSFNDITEIPEDIGNLWRLKKLLLFGNKIAPSLPKTMSKLVQLRKLDIRQNGILNLDAINDLPRLEELLVDYNTNISVSGSFKSLSRATFIKCNITEFDIRGTGGALTFLDVSSNKLSNLSESLFEHLRSLEVLKMDNNSISTIPGTISLLKRLRQLSISNNSMSALPEEICQLDSLTELDVHGNRLGELPASIWKCSLVYLNASSNILGNFPDPPKFVAIPNPGATLSTSSSSATLSDLDGTHGPSGSIGGFSASPAPSRSKPLPAPPVPLQSIPSGRSINAPPLAASLLSLSLADNRLPDDVMYPISQLTNLQILNVSHNFITEIPRGKIPNPGQILELYLSGNQLTSLPAEDIERLRCLRILHVNGNKLTTLPAELGKIYRLGVLDVGCNSLKYNISNWPYDWNWNWNLELKYLNMSGNKRLQIKRQNVEPVMIANSKPGNLSEFGNLTRLRILGLMDVTITDNVPENSVERRVRTSMSTVDNMSYGMADTLGNSDNLCIWDLVHPKFQGKEDESLFGLFDGRSDKYKSSSVMTSHLKDRFGNCLKIELEKLEDNDTVVSALRRTFLNLDRDLWPVTQDDDGKGGTSALVAYIKGVTMYCANVGDAIAVIVRKSDSFHVISQNHTPWNPTEAARIKRSGGFVSEKGLLNDELDLSRSFGQYHLVPHVNSNPFIEIATLSEEDDFVIMASSALWEVMSHSTAADIAREAKRAYGDLMYASQKLRDIAISYGAKDHMVVMLIGVGDLFKKREVVDGTEYHQPSYKRIKVPEGPTDALKHLKPEIEPPQGDVAMVFTDIKNSTKLWENIPTAMGIAIKEHFQVMRRQLRDIGGYEVKNEGDALMASFSSVPAAMLWCFKVQELLVEAEWPQDILDSVECRAYFCRADTTRAMYRGLSVRMGIHWGRPVSDRDAVTRRMDYYGPMVNRAARICDVADGGETCVSSDVINMMQHLLEDTYLEESDAAQYEHVCELKKMGFGIIDLGERKLKGLETPENLHLIYPRGLAGRLTLDPSKLMSGASMAEAQIAPIVVQSTVLDAASVRSLQLICLRLERVASGATALHGRVTDQSLALLSLPIKDNADQADLARIAEHYIVRIENCFSQLYMAKSGYFVNVFESLGRAIDTDPSYILRALQMYVGMMGGMESSNLL